MFMSNHYYQEGKKAVEKETDRQYDNARKMKRANCEFLESGEGAVKAFGFRK